MKITKPIRLRCPREHHLHAPPRAIGKTLPCPVCRAMVTVSLERRDPLSDTSVLRILGDKIASIAAKQPPAPQPAKREELSDTGVMRILGDFPEQTPLPQTNSESSMRICTECDTSSSRHAAKANESTVYLGPAPDYMIELSNAKTG